MLALFINIYICIFFIRLNVPRRLELPENTVLDMVLHLGKWWRRWKLHSIPNTHAHFVARYLIYNYYIYFKWKLQNLIIYVIHVLGCHETELCRYLELQKMQKNSCGRCMGIQHNSCSFSTICCPKIERH